MGLFSLQSNWEPAGDQPNAIEQLVAGVRAGEEKQTLLGVTGSGKTFTIANVIDQIEKPTLVIAHNKTLAAQLAQEYREFFPDAAVHYFVSYYDYYQPEAYMPNTDTYIEKDAQINEEIDRLRHATTQALLTRRDVIIVASVSCIYGLGSPAEYKKRNVHIQAGEKMSRSQFMRTLLDVHYTRTSADVTPGTFRATGTAVEVMPISETTMYRCDFAGGILDTIEEIDPVSSERIATHEHVFIFPAKHFLTAADERERAIARIQEELAERLAYFEKHNMLLEADRLRRRTKYDIAMIREVGYCSGIENYARHLSGRDAGDTPDTLLSYFPHKADGTADFLTVIDESHVTIPQIRGMFAGDRARKETLIKHGFRLPSAKDNRPLTFDEFETQVGQSIYTSATPGPFERDESDRIVEQIIRPTGLVDPTVTVKPVTPTDTYTGQVQHFIAEAQQEIASGGRVLATTLTKKMAEDLSEYLAGEGIQTEYLHSDIKTIDRIRILTRFRKGDFDCLVGVNLLREGLDLPEVSFIGILDADKEGFLRSETSLIQTIGRAARNEAGRVILYADQVTGSLERAIGETNRRREKQVAHNKKHGITPKTIEKRIHDITEELESSHDKAVHTELAIDAAAFKEDPDKLIKLKKEKMEEAVEALDFETAAILRDEIYILQEKREET